MDLVLIGQKIEKRYKMPRQDLWKVQEDDGEWSVEYPASWHARHSSEDEINKHPTLTLEELADFSDRKAESRNNHAFTGTHRILAAFLHKKPGRVQATEIMQGIAEYGGLDGMSGIGGQPSAFADFGIKDGGDDWSLPD